MSKSKYVLDDGSLNLAIITKSINDIKEEFENFISINEFKKIRSRLYYLKRVCAKDPVLSKEITKLIDKMKSTVSEVNNDKNGLYIENIRIVKLDNLNYTFEVYGKVEKKDGSVEYKWMPSNCYYSNITSCLNGVKNKIINDYIKLRKSSVGEFLALLNKINNSIVNLVIKTKEE